MGIPAEAAASQGDRAQEVRNKIKVLGSHNEQIHRSIKEGWQPQAQLGDGSSHTIPKAFGFEAATQSNARGEEEDKGMYQFKIQQ